MLNLDDLNKVEHKRAMELMYNSQQYRELERQLQTNNARVADLKPEIRLAAIYLLKYGGEFMLDDLWRMFYRRKPPTIQEFLTDNYLPETNQILYPQWRKDLTELFDVGSTFFEYVIGGAIGGGKTTCAIVAHLYNLIRVACLINPHATLGSAPNKTLVMSMFTLTLPKARKALIEPFLSQMKECSEVFELVDDRREMKADFPSYANSDKIPFFDNMSEIILPNNINVMLGSQVSHALSFDMFGAFLDEAEFRDKSGGPEKALEVWNSLRTRVTSRFLGSRFTFASLVSSARYSTGIMATYVKSISPDSKKEKYSSFPIWEIKSFDAYKDGHFYVLRGNSAHPSQVLNDEYNQIEAGGYVVPEGCEVLKVPKVYYREFTHDLVNSIKDLAGMQLVTENYPFPKVDDIVDKNLVPEFTIVAPIGEGIPLLTKLPQELFTDTPHGRRFARYGSALRYAHIDLAETNVGGLSIVHKERLGDQTVYVTDLTCEIVSPTRIDISSIFQLMIDLKQICGVSFFTISADQYQSADGRQRLEVMSVAQNVNHLSVDSTLGPISDMARLVIENKLKVGKCPNLQTQMRQLQVDPSASKGKVKRGEAGKDQFDSICGAITNAISNIYDVPDIEYIVGDLEETLSSKMKQAFDGLKML